MMRRFLTLALGTVIAIAAADPAYAGITISGQPPSSKLTDIAALAVTDSNVIVGDGTTWVAESGATARTSLGVAIGLDVQAYDADLAQLLTGTAATPQFARLGLGAAADANHLLLTSTGADVKAAQFLQTSTFASILNLKRTGGTAAEWEMYLPSGSTDLRWTDDGTAKLTLTTAGALAATGGLSGTTGTFNGNVQATGSINAVTADGNAGLVLTNSGVSTQAWSLFGLANGGNNDLAWYRAGSGAGTKMILDATGSLSIDTATWTDNGSIGRSSHGTGTTPHFIGNQSITTSSDRRIKTDIRPSKLNAGDVIERLAVVDFRYADDSIYAKSYNARKRIPGLIAQDVEKVLPMFVNTQGVSGDGPLGTASPWNIDYPAMVPVLVKALQEQATALEAEKTDAIESANVHARKLVALEARLAALEEGSASQLWQLRKQQTQINALEARLAALDGIPGGTMYKPNLAPTPATKPTATPATKPTATPKPALKKPKPALKKPTPKKKAS